MFLGGFSLFYSFFLKSNFILSQRFFVSNQMLEFSLDFFFDKNSVLFLGVLLVIVFSVKEFSEFYLEKDFNYKRFYWILMRFVFSMCIVIFIPNLVFLLIGWDGLGLTRFILIVYYKTRNSWFCGLKTYLINRLGDGLIFLWLITLFSQGHWNILSSDYYFKILILFTIILGLFTKRAQFPFCSWLPAAMAAPTPVSALVHSSTLVTAGIFVLYRVSSNFGDHSLKLIGVISCYTMLLARFSACFEWDFKKIIAFSTLSQLGLMGIALSLGLHNLCFFHLLTHAVFKALLFISAGVLLGQVFHFQDIRNLSNIKGFNPLIDFVLLARIMALGGFPFLAGFFSKDLILERKIKIFSFVFKIFLWIRLPLTIFYSFRIIYFIWGGGIACHKTYISLSATKLLSVIFLFFSSCWVGKFLSPLFLKNCFLSYAFKGVILLLLGGGFYVVCSSKNSLFSWYFSNISFCESKNTTLPRFFLRKSGNKFFVFDQGLNQRVKRSILEGLFFIGNFKKFVTVITKVVPLKSMFLFFLLFFLNTFIWGLKFV